MVPRVLMVGRACALDGVEPVVAPDGEAALRLLRRERVDAVVVDLALAPLDGWCVLAALGARDGRPHLVAIAADESEAARARTLGADSCLPAGTSRGARALVRSTKETPWPVPPRTDFRRPTPTGASA